MITITPASQYALAELTTIYNQSRSDYLVPMPMVVEQMQQFIRVYSIELAHSVVAVDEAGQPLGLGFLGVRQQPTRAWITRLGVLPTARTGGIGAAMMGGLLAQAEQAGANLTILEVIRGNAPAHRLFLRHGFQETRVMLLLDREANAPQLTPVGHATQLDSAAVVARLNQRREPPSWTNETETLTQTAGLTGFDLQADDGSAGWLACCVGDSLTRVVIETITGDAESLGRVALSQLHAHYPGVAAHVENIPAYDRHLPAFTEVGYTVRFTRQELVRYAIGWPPQNNGDAD